MAGKFFLYVNQSREVTSNRISSFSEGFSEINKHTHVTSLRKASTLPKSHPSITFTEESAWLDRSRGLLHEGQSKIWPTEQERPGKKKTGPCLGETVFTTSVSPFQC